MSQSVSLVGSFGFYLQLLFPRGVLRHLIRTYGHVIPTPRHSNHEQQRDCDWWVGGKQQLLELPGRVYTLCHEHARLDTRHKQGMQRVEVRKLGARFVHTFILQRSIKIHQEKREPGNCKQINERNLMR